MDITTVANPHRIEITRGVVYVQIRQPEGTPHLIGVLSQVFDAGDSRCLAHDGGLVSAILKADINGGLTCRVFAAGCGFFRGLVFEDRLDEFLAICRRFNVEVAKS